MLEKFDEGAAFLAEKFGSHWDSPKAQHRKNHALFLYTSAKQPDKGFFSKNILFFISFHFYIVQHFTYFSLYNNFKLMIYYAMFSH